MGGKSRLTFILCLEVYCRSRIYTLAAYTELLMAALDWMDDGTNNDNANGLWMQISEPLALNAFRSASYGCNG